MFASPAQAIGRVALGDARRTQLQLQLTGAVPVEMESAAAIAVVASEVVLAAAIVTCVDRMPSSRRPFSINEPASRAGGSNTTPRERTARWGTSPRKSKQQHR